MTIPHSCLPLQGKLIVSCQSDEGDAFHGLMDRFARAALTGGASGIRANGPADIRAIHQAVPLPIIGIQKVIHHDGRILITPTFEAAQALVEAGAIMVALDCTKRGQRYGAFERLQRIKAQLRVPVLADIATVDEAQQAVSHGADLVLSTMRGYTDDTAHVSAFDPAFVHELVRTLNVPVIAEGHIDSPALARQAIRAGAFAVVVGSAITRPHLITRDFARAVQQEWQSSQDNCFLGIDLGGTNTKFGLVSQRGGLIWKDTRPTPAAAGRTGLLKHLEEITIHSLQHSRQLGFSPSAVGIATAGSVNPETGSIVYATENLPGWTGTRIAETIQASCGLPVHVENDANALAVGEKVFGAARAFDDFVCITLGTGVGGGCFIAGRLNHGSHFFGNAFGHVSIHPGGRPCTCGRNGCLEAYANAAALLEFAGHQFADPVNLLAAAHQGEPVALQALDTFASHLAIGCSLLVQLLDPEALILAGGLAQDNPLLLSLLEQKLSTLVSMWEKRRPQILASQAGYHAGVLGAAAVAAR